MQENNVFEYALIRAVPRVEREEFINVGVILLCQRQKFLQVKYFLHENKLKALQADLDTENLERHLKAYQRIAQGAAEGGPIATLSPAERFRWLTAARSTVIQSSKVHPGLTSDAQRTLEHLFQEYVL